MYLEECDLGSKAISVDKLMELLQSLKEYNGGNYLLTPNVVGNLRIIKQHDDKSYSQVGWVDIAWEENRFNPLTEG